MSIAPHTRPGVWPEIGAARWAASVRTSAAGCRAALLGLPDDLGVRLNHGRPGAADGPRAIRAALARFGTAWDAGAIHADADLPGAPIDAGVLDAGDVVPATPAEFGGDAAAALSETHRRVTEAAEAIHAAGLVLIGLGGGHDLTYPAVRALARRVGGPVGGVNVDAHLDVRETIGSGMPFRRLIDEGLLDPSRFAVLGVNRFANSAEHAAWLLDRGASIQVMRHASDVREVRLPPGLSGARRAAFLSFDLDVLDAGVAPGVSAMNPAGLSVLDTAAIVEQAGADPSIRHFDLMELSPPNDRPAPPDVGRTARSAAYLLLVFLSGLSRRPA
ncbi:MAG: arginase family protein [Phycisphaerales bacterium]|nr:arginase family protein [Phycisphaerales bacterium]